LLRLINLFLHFNIKRRCEIILQMAYKILQSPDVSLGLVHHSSNPHRPAKGAWIGPFRYPTWVADYLGWRGSHTSVSTHGGEFQNPEPRPQYSWHIYAPGTAYIHRDDHPERCNESLWFFFTLNAPLLPLSSRPFTVVVDAEERIAPHVRAMYAAQQSGVPASALISHGHLLTVLGEFIAAQGNHAGTSADPWRTGSSGKNAGADTLLQQVDDIVMRRIAAPPDMDRLAEQLNVSVSTLAHRFKDETGQTVMERVRWLRVREARRLLSERGVSVKAAAQKLGFSSPFHLSKLFREITGMTAADYIRQNQR
jgi:AraC-like DNA-binding protein